MATAAADARSRTLRQLRRLPGAFRTAQALAAGIHPRTLYGLRDDGELEQLSRGIFRLASLPAPANPDLLVVAARLPKAVICLVSALAFHGLTEEIPHEVHIALPRGASTPHLEHPPLRVTRFRPEALRAGVEVHEVDGVDLRVYSPAKTIADCFRSRSQVGMETTLAALKALRRRRGFDPEQLLHFAKICRVERALRPYLEAVL